MFTNKNKNKKRYERAKLKALLRHHRELGYLSLVKFYHLPFSLVHHSSALRLPFLQSYNSSCGFFGLLLGPLHVFLIAVWRMRRTRAMVEGKIFFFLKSVVFVFDIILWIHLQTDHWIEHMLFLFLFGLFIFLLNNNKNKCSQTKIKTKKDTSVQNLKHSFVIIVN